MIGLFIILGIIILMVAAYAEEQDARLSELEAEKDADLFGSERQSDLVWNNRVAD